MPRLIAALAAVVLFLGLSFPAARAQGVDNSTFDARWYRAGTSAKIGVAADGVYRVTGAELAAAGFPIAAVPFERLELVENGRAVPLLRLGGSGAMLALTDTLVFAGRRNRGTTEQWAYDRPESQSSAFYSLFSDTTYYWLRPAEGAAGLRYAPLAAPTGAVTLVSTVRDTFHVETNTTGNETVYEGDPAGSGHPWYTRGEGIYFSRYFATTNAVSAPEVTVTIPGFAATSADTAVFQARVSSGSASGHRVRLQRLFASGFAAVDSSTWSGYDFRTVGFRAPASEVVQTGGRVRVRVEFSNPALGNPNIVYLDYVSAIAPRVPTATAGQDRFAMTQTGDVEVRPVGYGATARVLVLAPQAGLAGDLRASGGVVTVRTTLPRATTVWTSETGALRAPTRIVAVDRPPLTAFAGADYVILTTDALRPAAEALAAFHRTRSGYEVAIVTQQEVFDQFDYGRATPIATRRFAKATQAWGRRARFLALVGDALIPSRVRPLAPWEVPTFGNAPSDAWFAMQGNSPTDWTEFLAIGRIPIRTAAVGQAYVQKLVTYAQPPQAWIRRALHMSGGLNASERARLLQHQNAWAGLTSGAPARLDTTMLSKTSDLVVDGVYRDRLRDLFKQGQGWVAFFGHSSPQFWELLTDAPQDYQNALRLPIVLSLGCRTGAFTIGSPDLNTLSLSEALTIGSASGGVIHWGSSELSDITTSHLLSLEAHRVVFADGQRVLGEAFREAKARVARQTNGSTAVRNLMQYGLIGDPGVRYALPTGAELSVDASSVRATSDAPLAADASLELLLTIRNLGLMPQDSVAVALTHVRPGGASQTQTWRVAAFVDSLVVPVARPLGTADVGEHRFTLVVDGDARVAETNELDNRAEARVTVYGSGLSLASPGRDDIASRTPTLRVTPVSVLGGDVPVILELDTTDAFTSPARRATRLSGRVSIDWAVPGPLDEGRTYRWRARVDEPGQENVWATGRFTVRSDLTPGYFAPAERLQQATLEHLRWTGTAWAFERDGRFVQLVSERDASSSLVGVMTLGVESFVANTVGWGVVVVDRAGRVKAAGSRPTFTQTPTFDARFGTGAQGRTWLDSLAGTLAEGDLVLARSRHTTNRGGPVIQDEVKAIMRRFGSVAVDTLTYTHMWAMIARKGPGTTFVEREEIVVPYRAPSGTDPGSPPNMEINRTAYFDRDSGRITTARIGPSMRWERAFARVDVAGGAAQARVEVLAPDGTLLREATPAAQPLDLSSINARVHPYLQLRVTVRDSTRATTPQLRSAYALFDRVPDLTLDGGALTLSRDSLAEAEPLRVTIPVAHLGASGATDALVRYTVVDAGNRERLAATDTLRALAPGTRRTSSATIATTGLSGRNRLRVSVEQPGLAEGLLSNNSTQTTFTVAPDRQRPRFVVRLDGEVYAHDPSAIANLQDPRYPIVSARPSVEVLVSDGATFRPISDTSFARLSLDGKTIRFSRPDVRFEPATATRPDARLVFTPDLSDDDATHTINLRVFDASGNEAEGSPYQVHFRVSRTTAVEEVLPYPNPMRDRTTFAFRLRGADASAIEELRLRIFTVSGALVREFDLVEDASALASGAIRIGWNRLRWDGTDADGDPLASGVYLYRVQARAAGEALGVEGGSRVERLVIVR